MAGMLSRQGAVCQMIDVPHSEIANIWDHEMRLYVRGNDARLLPRAAIHR